MSQLLRLLCVCLGVTIMVAVQMHGVINNQHRVEHSVQFPDVSYEDMTQIAHDHDHDHSLDATADEAASDTAIDVADESGKTPFSHHHHNGGDIHVALNAPVDPVALGAIAALDLGPAPDALPPGALLDAPHQPPRQNA